MTSKKILAVVEQTEITQEDVEKLKASMNPQEAAQLQNTEGQKRLVHELIHQRLLSLHAKEAKMDEEEDFQKELNQVKNQMLGRYALSKLLSEVHVNEEEITTFYNENTFHFAKPESGLKASHIQIMEKETADNVYAEIQEGLSFEEAGKRYSSCESTDLGYFPRGKMVQEFDDVAFNMQVDEISKPVKTEFGYHIIKVHDIKEEEYRPLGEVQDQIKQHLISSKEQQLYKAKMDDLKQTYDVKINP